MTTPIPFGQPLPGTSTGRRDLSGRGGTDILNGSPGADMLDGGAGQDTLDGRTGSIR